MREAEAIKGFGRARGVAPGRFIQGSAAVAALVALGLLAVLAGCSLVVAPAGMVPSGGGGACPALDNLPRPVRLMGWNAENLFDDCRDGNEYPEFVPATDTASQGWNRAAYRARLERCGRVIREAGGLPDVVVLCEIETPKVLEDLRRDFLPVGSYPEVLLQADPGSVIHLAVLSRLPLRQAFSHACTVGDEAARPIWELHLALPGPAGPDGKPRELVLFANHWKSKVGGEAATEALRLAAAACLEREAGRLLAERPDALVVACGDFNEEVLPAGQVGRGINSSGRAVSSGRVTGGITPRLLTRAGTARALASRADGSVSLAGGSLGWLSPWGGDPGGYTGSYVYDGQWEAIDHFLLARPAGSPAVWPARLGFRVVAAPFQLDDDGFPRRWDSRTGKGISDHLPLLLELNARAPEGSPPG